jgi:hypothetical protein
MVILCDTCLIEKGHGPPMTGPHSMLLHSGMRSEKGDVVYSCDQGCERHYEQHHGYFNLSDEQGIINLRSVPLCQCHELIVMYIAEILAEGTVRYRCPHCGRDAVALMPTHL